MTQDYTPVGPSSPPIETQESTPSPRFPWNKVLIFGCGGCAVVSALALLLGGWALMKFGLGVFADEVESELRANPVIIDHVGRIEEFELDLGASVAEAGDDDFVFKVSGTKGSGLVTATCVTNDDGIEEVVAGTIQLESGETLDLFPEDDTVVDEVEIVEESE
jgi:hypothetical protein